jgi:hypothetical protein
LREKNKNERGEKMTPKQAIQELKAKGVDATKETLLEYETQGLIPKAKRDWCDKMWGGSKGRYCVIGENNGCCCIEVVIYSSENYQFENSLEEPDEGMEHSIVIQLATIDTELIELTGTHVSDEDGILDYVIEYFQRIKAIRKSKELITIDKVENALQEILK